MKVLGEVIQQIDGLTLDERFDWGLQVIITGLKLKLKDMKKSKK